MVRHRTGRALVGILACLTTVTALLLAMGSEASAKTSGAMSSSFFELARPARLDFTLFGGGYISDESEAAQEGRQINQSVTSSIGLVGRIIGYQLFYRQPVR
jgi:hypothetical protein